MHLTTFSDLGLRTLMVLGDEGDRGQLQTIGELAENLNASRNHMPKVVAKLAELGMVDAVRGRNGGVQISEKGRHASVGKLLRVLEGPGEVVDCEGGMACPLAARDCALRHRLAAAQEAFFAALDGDTVAELIAQTKPKPGRPVSIGLPNSIGLTNPSP